MNYIHQLQNSIKRQESNADAAREVLLDLRRYLLSDKFSCGDELDGYVNVKDVLSRIEQIRTELDRS